MNRGVIRKHVIGLSDTVTRGLRVSKGNTGCTTPLVSKRPITCPVCIVGFLGKHRLHYAFSIQKQQMVDRADAALRLLTPLTYRLSPIKVRSTL